MATTQDPQLSDTAEAMPALGETGPTVAGIPLPSPPACPQPQPCRAVVFTCLPGAARERPSPRIGNGRSDGLDGAPRTQRRPRGRRYARLPSTDGKSRPGTDADHPRSECESLSRRAVGPPVRARWLWSLLCHPLLPPTRVASTGSPRSEANPTPAQSQAQPPWGFLHLRNLFCVSVLLIT